MLQPIASPLPPSVEATSFIGRLRTGAGRRTLGLGLALLMELLLLLVLLSLEPGWQGSEKESRTIVVNVSPDRADEAAPAPASLQPADQAEAQPASERPTPDEPLPRPVSEPPPPRSAPPSRDRQALAQPPLSRPNAQQPAPSPAPAPVTQAPSNAIRPGSNRSAGPAGPLYGPPAPAGRASLDSERVGTAPNGEPMYAAAWYTRPRPDQLRGYLATASGPGWGLIACRTAPGYRVEDCVPLDEYPQGSQINRAILAAAWEFKVRPPRLGGRSLVGSWVRIRIDYTINGR